MMAGRNAILEPCHGLILPPEPESAEDLLKYLDREEVLMLHVTKANWMAWTYLFTSIGVKYY